MRNAWAIILASLVHAVAVAHADTAGGSSFTFARPTEVGEVRAKIIEGHIDVTLDLDQPAFLGILNTAGKPTSDRPNPNPLEIIRDATLGQTHIRSDGVTCPWQATGSEFKGPLVHVWSTAVCEREPEELQWEMAFVRWLPSRTFLRIIAERDGYRNEFRIYHNQVAPPVAILLKRPALLHSFLLGFENAGLVADGWVQDGQIHLPDGIYYLLFVLAIMALGTGFVRSLQAIGGFALANSLAMLIALSCGSTLPTRLMPFVSAGLLIVLATHRLVLRKSPQPWIIGSIFGAMHGWIAVPDLIGASLGKTAIIYGVLGFNSALAAALVVITSVLVGLSRLKRLYKKRKVSEYLVLILVICLCLLVKALLQQ